MFIFRVLSRQPAAAKMIGEPTELPELPERAPDRGPPYWASTILRRKTLGYHEG